MFKKTIQFKDLDGVPVTEDFYFHLSKAEIAEMELAKEGGLSEFIKKMVEDQNGKVIIETFKEIISKSYGIRGDDGKRFIKSEEISNNFLQSDAYSELFMSLVTNADASAEFIRGIVPVDLAVGIASVDVDLPPLRKVEDVTTALNSTPVEDIVEERKRLQERLAELEQGTDES